MANEWYYNKNGTKHGPVAGAELKALAEASKLLPTDLVWKEGMTGWKPASSVKGLFPAAPVATPPPSATPHAANSPDLASAAKGLLGAAAATAKRVAAKATETAKDVQTKAQDQLAKAVDGANQPDGTPSAPRIQAGTLRLTGRGLIGLLLVGGVLSVCVLGLIVAAVLFFVTRSGDNKLSPAQAETEHQFLRSFDEHPPPILQSVKEGKRVWLLSDYRSDTTTGLHKAHKEALYAIFADGELQYVVHKVHHDPNHSKRVFGKDHEVDTWEQMPAGESQPADTIRRTWEGKEESPELARLKFTQNFESTDKPDNIVKNDTTAEIEIRWNKGGTQASWQSVVVSSSSVKTRGQEFPTRYEKQYQGFGKLLQSP
jgi:hypothetical protein